MLLHPGLLPLLHWILLHEARRFPKQPNSVRVLGRTDVSGRHFGTILATFLQEGSLSDSYNNGDSGGT